MPTCQNGEQMFVAVMESSHDGFICITTGVHKLEVVSSLKWFAALIVVPFLPIVAQLPLGQCLWW